MISSKDRTLIEDSANSLRSKQYHNGKIVTSLLPKSSLTLVATPIGNLSDISLRGLDAFRQADLILCEDTRVTKKLIQKYGISNNVLSYHEHNAEYVRPKIVQKLKLGARIILVSDAGTPTISDPGYRLVQACLKNKIEVSTVPGPTALITALTISGLPTDSFYFGGFLPTKKLARRKIFMARKELESTLIFYDSARRLSSSLIDAVFCFDDRQAAVARELTKLHEEIKRGSLTELSELFLKSGPPKGEVVLLIGPPGKKLPVTDQEIDQALQELLVNNTIRDSVKIVSDKLGVKRSLVYERALNIKQQGSA